MEENDVSHLDSLSANQVKGKRRSKLKMPLKKIPKRKQNSLTEQITLCQDMAQFEFPDNLSALIVSSLGPDDNKSSYPQASLDKGTGTTSISPCGNPSKKQLVERQRKLSHPPPPLVSIARASTANQTVSFPSTSGLVGGDAFNKMIRQVGCGTGPSLLRNDQQTLPSNLYSSISQVEHLFKNGYHCQQDQTFSGSYQDEVMSRTLNTSESYDSAQSENIVHKKIDGSGNILYGKHSVNGKHFQAKFESGGINVVRPFSQSDKFKSQYETSETVKSKLSLKSPNGNYKAFAPDMSLPLVQVKPPLLAPISPERKRIPTAKRSLLMKKNPSEATPGAAPTRGRKPNEKNRQNKEIWDGAEKKANGVRKSRQKWCPRVESVNEQVGTDDDDDVIITGVVNLNELRRYDHSFTNVKRNFNVRKNSKYYQEDVNPMMYNPDDYFVNGQQIGVNIPSQSSKKKNTGKRGSYTKKNAKNQVGAIDLNAKDLDMRKSESSNPNRTGLSRCERKCERCSLKSELVLKDSTNIPSSELDDKQRDEHFSTIIDAIKKEDDLIKSTMRNKMNKNLETYESVDWRSWLNVFDRNPICTAPEIGSGTDSGNEDDLILRDLSEFLLLSEDRRHSRKQTEEFENAHLNDLPFTRRNLTECDFNFNGSNINFDSIDSSINLINSIDTDLKVSVDNRSKTFEECASYEDNIYYSKWQSTFDNYPKYPVLNRYKNRSDNYWTRFLMTERNPILGDTDEYRYRSIIPDKEKRLEESATKAGCILRSETAERGIAPSYESKFYRKRIYRKKNMMAQE